MFTIILFLTVYSSSAATSTNSNSTHITSNSSSATTFLSNESVSETGIKSSRVVVGDQEKSTSDLSVSYKTSNTHVNYLKNVYITIKATNNGPDDSNGIIVSYKLNKYLTWISDDSNSLYDKSNGIWYVGTLNNGSSKTLNIIAQVNSHNTNFNTTTTVQSESSIDSNLANNVASVNFIVPATSDLSVTQKFSSNKVNYLHYFMIEVNVKNNGPDVADNVTVNCYLNPHNLGFISSNQNKRYKSSSGIWTIGSMNPGSQTVLRIWTKLLVYNKWIANSVKSNSLTYDYNQSNNKAKAVLHSPPLTIRLLANDLSVGTHSRYDRASNILNWVRDNIVYSFYYNTKYGAAGTLKYLKGNCADTAHLVVALARVSGFTARYKHGICYFIESGHWYGHVWADIYVNGRWYSADATGYKNTLGVIKNWNTSTFTLRGTYNTLPF